MLLALVCALAANVSYGIGTVLQAAGARRTSTSEHLDVMLFARLSRQLPYLAGLGLDAIGFVASIVALRTLPLFVVQAAIAGSVGVTALASVFAFGFRLRASDVRAIGVLIVGLVLLGASAHGEHAAHLSRLGGWLLLLGVGVVAIGGIVGGPSARRPRRYRAGRVRGIRLLGYRDRGPRAARAAPSLAASLRAGRGRARALRHRRDAHVRQRTPTRIGHRDVGGDVLGRDHRALDRRARGARRPDPPALRDRRRRRLRAHRRCIGRAGPLHRNRGSCSSRNPRRPRSGSFSTAVVALVSRRVSDDRGKTPARKVENLRTSISRACHAADYATQVPSA